MSEVLEFLASFEDGATEEDLCRHFRKLNKMELAAILNSLLQSNQIEVAQLEGRMHYRAVRNKTTDYEAMILALLGQIGSNGMWLRDIKTKTNIPHNLVLKILRNLEAARKIKSLKSIKNNRKMYMLYDVKPNEEVTGGVWFSNNDVDLVFVNKLMDVIYRYCHRPEEEYALTKIDSLATMMDVRDFIAESGISEVELSMSDIAMLVDCLVCDGRMEKIAMESGVALRTLREAYLKR